MKITSILFIMALVAVFGWLVLVLDGCEATGKMPNLEGTWKHNLVEAWFVVAETEDTHCTVWIRVNGGEYAPSVWDVADLRSFLDVNWSRIAQSREKIR